MIAEQVSKVVRRARREGVRAAVLAVARYVHTWMIRPQVIRLRVIARHLLQRSRYEAVADPYKVVWVDPDEIRLYTDHFDKWGSIARVEGGDWDRRSRTVTSMPKYVAVRERFEEGRDWRETSIYAHLLTLIDRHGEYDGCTSLSGLEDRYARIDDLYESMARQGYDADRHDPPPAWWQYRELDYVAVHVGRDGALIFGKSGCHRLSIAQLLDVERIPVWIRARHERWQRRRDALARAAAAGRLSDGALERLDHPDLRDLVAADPSTGA